MFEPIGGTAPDHVGQGHDQPARGDRRGRRCCSRSSARTGAAARVDAGHPVRVLEDGVDARRRDGVLDRRGRRPRRRGGDRVSEAPFAAGRAVRHDAPRRRAADRPVVLDRGPPADPPQDRPARRAVHRGRLAGREPARHRVLPARDEGDAAARDAHVVRHDPQGGRARRGQRRPARAARHRDRGRLPRRQVVGPARHRGAPHRPRRGRRDGARLDRVPARAGPAGVLRRRALLRRLPQQPGVRDARARAARGGRRRATGPVRHERRHAAGRRRARSSTRSSRGRRRRRSASTCTTTPGARSPTR